MDAHADAEGFMCPSTFVAVWTFASLSCFLATGRSVTEPHQGETRHRGKTRLASSGSRSELPLSCMHAALLYSRCLHHCSTFVGALTTFISNARRTWSTSKRLLKRQCSMGCASRPPPLLSDKKGAGGGGRGVAPVVPCPRYVIFCGQSTDL